MHRYVLRVRYADVDRMGWAYYGEYFRWFEIGRTELLRSLGRSYRDIEARSGVMLPVRSARCRYLRGSRYDDALAIETGVLTRSRAGVTFAYRIVPEAGGPPNAVGLTEHFFMTVESKPVRAPADVNELLERAPVAPQEILELLEG